MRYTVLFSALLASVLVAPVLAEHGNVPESAVRVLGLVGLKTVPDVQGLEVRGAGAGTVASGLSLVSGVLIDPNTNSFVFGADANIAQTCADVGSLCRPLTSYEETLSTVGPLSLSITTGLSVFNGALIGGAGGAAAATASR